MKQILLSILVVGILLLGACGAPAPSSDAKQVEAVLREYYEAFDCYDCDRIMRTIAEQSIEEEGSKILLALVLAESINLKYGLVSVTSIQIDGDSALAIVEGKTSLDPGQDVWHLVREGNGWKIANKVVQDKVF